MKTTLNADGNIGIPAEIRQTDQLTAGDSFELERLIPATTSSPGSPPLARASWFPSPKMEFQSFVWRTVSSLRGL